MSGATQPHLPATHEPPVPQLTPHMPQLFWSAVRSTHWPLQSVKPAGQAHFPPLHAWPPEQTLPQPPQFCESVFSFTQLKPHATSGLVQLLTQLELWQKGEVPAHARPHTPQLFGSLASERHCPLQLEVPTGQAQAPLLQASPPVQASPHLPQLSGSVLVMTQA